MNLESSFFTITENPISFEEAVTSENASRLVARGFQQELDNELYDVYAPVAKLATFRILLIVGNKMQKPIYQMDVRSAFLYGDIKDEVYMSLPGQEDSENKCMVPRSTQFDRYFKDENKEFNTSLDIEHKCDGDEKLYLLIYVDDVLILGTNQKAVNKLKAILNENFSMKDLGVISQYLGVDIEQNLDTGCTKVSQVEYLKEVIQKYGMQDCNAVDTPIEANIDLNSLKSETPNFEMQKICRKIIGSIMYAALGTRPDLCESVSLLSRFQDKANENLFKALKRLLRYVKGTIEMVLFFEPNKSKIILQGFVDSDWGGDTTDRKSTSGFVFKMYDCTISWASRKQSTVAISSTESEFVALSLAVCEACWLIKLLRDLSIEINEPVTLFEDIQSSIYIANNPERLPPHRGSRPGEFFLTIRCKCSLKLLPYNKEYGE
ncbi:uncharacterized mitochondrial protein AtMg00810-like [Leptopilina heterotoma]|uniref:uncharacterized mitochondrial protein AtMg00810-like n=1 Tax=Leptopilina heterotoma TaxID=63436 RepID=UPI001CA8A0DE|nr:uncharacterized mitochondrial protein AtMg00810-like [Leptopilina heterotoma]